MFTKEHQGNVCRLHCLHSAVGLSRSAFAIAPGLGAQWATPQLQRQLNVPFDLTHSRYPEILTVQTAWRYDYTQHGGGPACMLCSCLTALAQHGMVLHTAKHQLEETRRLLTLCCVCQHPTLSKRSEAAAPQSRQAMDQQDNKVKAHDGSDLLDTNQTASSNLTTSS